MKNILTTLLLMVAATGMASTPNDTLVVEQPRRVTVVTGDSIQSILVEGKAGNSNYTYQSKIELVDSNYTSTSAINSDDFRFSIGPRRNTRQTPVTMEGQSHWMIGCNSAPGMPREADIHTFESWEMWWVVVDMVWQPWKNPHHKFSLGIGLDWRTWRMHADKRFQKSENGRLDVVDYPENSEPNFSRIKVFSINFPLRYQHYLSNGCSWSFGPVLNFNLKSSLKTKYKLEGKKHTETQNGVHQNKVTVDLMYTVETPYFGIYCKYSPCHILDSGYGPKFHSLTLGLFF